MTAHREGKHDGMMRSPCTPSEEKQRKLESEKSELLDRSKHTLAQDWWVILMHSLALSVCSGDVQSLQA